jgi:hypothetical protein
MKSSRCPTFPKKLHIVYDKQWICADWTQENRDLGSTKHASDFPPTHRGARASMLKPILLQRCCLSLFRSVLFGLAMLVGLTSVSAGEIRWTGNAAVRYANGNDYNTLVSLGDPLFTLGAPGSVSLASGGLNWTLALVQDPRRYIQVAILASPLKAEAQAPQAPGTSQQTQRVQLQADFVITGLGSLGASMTASSNGTVMTSGRLTNTVGVIDSVQSSGTLSYTEAALAGVDPSASLFSGQRTWTFQASDSSPPVQTRPDPWEEEVGWKSDGTYRLTMEVDLRALAAGSDFQEVATAAWGPKFVYQQGFLTFVDVVPEPSTALLTVLAVGTMAALHLRRAACR